MGGAGRKSGRTLEATARILDIYPMSNEKPLEGGHDLIWVFKDYVSGH